MLASGGFFWKMNLDKRVNLLTDKQASSLEPIFEILEDETKRKYTLIEGEDIYHIQISKPFSRKEENTLIKTYIENKSDNNYRKIMNEALEEVMIRNTQSMGVHFMMDEVILAGYFLQRNLKIRRLMNE